MLLLQGPQLGKLCTRYYYWEQSCYGLPSDRQDNLGGSSWIWGVGEGQGLCGSEGGTNGPWLWVRSLMEWVPSGNCHGQKKTGPAPRPGCMQSFLLAAPAGQLHLQQPLGWPLVLSHCCDKSSSTLQGCSVGSMTPYPGEASGALTVNLLVLTPLLTPPAIPA